MASETSSLGDAIRAYCALRPHNPRTLNMLLRALGLAHATPDEERTLAAERLKLSEMLESMESAGTTHRIDPEADLPRSVKSRAARQGRGAGQPMPLRPKGRRDPDLRKLRARVKPPPYLVARPEPQPYHTLFKPPWQNGLIVETLSEYLPIGEIDLDRLIDDAASMRPIENIPRLPMRVLWGRLEVLVDIGKGMEPFVEDRGLLVRRIGDIVGEHSLTVRKFRGCPLHGAGTGPVSRWKKPFKPSDEVAVLLVVSDFAVSDSGMPSSSVDDWRQFVELVLASDCRLIGLSPYSNDRIAPALTRVFPIVQWDRSTTVGEVRRLKRIGWGL